MTSVLTPQADDLRAALQRIADYESGVRPGAINRALLALGTTRGFALIYRRLGPPLDTWLYRTFQGRVSARVYGLPGLLLSTTGARTGVVRTVPLVHLRDGDDFLVTGTSFGRPNHPAWTNNLLKHPEAQIEVGPVRLHVRAALVDEAGFREAWPRFVAVSPAYERYLARSGRVPRVFRLVPTNCLP
jgi:deazaflavin-dependent oxidoreductase (nitroreductase family)